jgi:hypothetical protein
MPGLDGVFDPLSAEHALKNAVMAKGYDSKHIRDKLPAAGMNPVLPPKSNRQEVIVYEKDSEKVWEKVERFFNKLK